MLTDLSSLLGLILDRVLAMMTPCSAVNVNSEFIAGATAAPDWLAVSSKPLDDVWLVFNDVILENKSEN